MKTHEIKVEEDKAVRIDKYLIEKLPEYSRSFIQKQIEKGGALINGKPAAQNAKVRLGDVILLNIDEPVSLDISPQNIDLEIVYEDDDLAVINKPQGMVVHPAAGNNDKTLVNALLYHLDKLSGINGVIRPGIVHRIDKDTSGLLIVAKNDNAHIKLSEQIKEHSFKREYEAIVTGNIKEDKLTVNAPIGRHPKDRKKMAITDKNSKPAVTHVKVLKRFGSYTYIRCRLETGRTHQIRVHLSSRGYFILGDKVYKPSKPVSFGLNGQCLHAKTIGFIHPVSGEYMEFTSELPDYFKEVLTKLENMVK